MICEVTNPGLPGFFILKILHSLKCPVCSWLYRPFYIYYDAAKAWNNEKVGKGKGLIMKLRMISAILA